MRRRNGIPPYCSPQGLNIEDLKLAHWFLDIVAPRYGGLLHSHAPVLPVVDDQGGRRLTSLSTLFYTEWPHVSLGNLLEALAKVGYITAPQAQTDGYTFYLLPDRAHPCAASWSQQRQRRAGTPKRTKRAWCDLISQRD
jgi:hypothetical protein